MTLAAARNYAVTVLHEAFGKAVRQALKVTCTPVSDSRALCGISFSSATNYYFGSVSVFYMVAGGKLYWNDAYTVHWVNSNCFFHTEHPKRCPVSTRRGS